MKKTFYIPIIASTAAALLLLSLLAKPGRERTTQEKELQKAEIFLRHTPVKDQGKTNACWIYAYLACIETERIEHYGDSMHLSPAWLIHCMMHEQAREKYLRKGDYDISARGIGPEAERLMNEYGMVPWSNFKPADNINSNAIARDITNKVNIAIRNRKGLEALKDDIDSALPRLPHNLISGFYLYGMHYTPLQFAKSLTYGINFQWLTSYTHHPFNETFDIELPDNSHHHRIMNLPIDSLYHAVTASLRNHHPVFWEGKMGNYNGNEDGKASSAKQLSFAATENCSKKEIQEERQKAFEQFKVTDQHAMAIIGITYDSNKQPLFICKNSWGKEWGRGGYCIMPASDFLLNTIIVGVIN